MYIIFTTLAGIRYYVGTDYETYTMHQIPDSLDGYLLSAGYKVEPLYRLVIYIGTMLGSSQWIFVITHLIIMYFILKYIKEQSDDYVFSILIFVFGTFFSFSLNGMRQSIATAIFLYATKFIYNKSYIKYFLYIIIACLFHMSAIIYVPFYFLNRFVLTKRSNVVPVTIIAIVLALNSSYAYGIVYKIFLKYNFYTKFFDSKYNVGTQINTMYLSMFFLNLLVVYVFYILQDNKAFKLKDTVMLNIQLISLMFSAIAFSIPGAFRAFYFFIPVQIVLVPNIVKNISNVGVRWAIKIVLLAVYIFIFVELILISNQNETLPYQTIFSNYVFYLL